MRRLCFLLRLPFHLPTFIFLFPPAIRLRFFYFFDASTFVHYVVYSGIYVCVCLSCNFLLAIPPCFQPLTARVGHLSPKVTIQVKIMPAQWVAHPYGQNVNLSTDKSSKF